MYWSLLLKLISTYNVFSFQVNSFPQYFKQAHADREDCYMKLLKHRELVREDKYLFNSHQREHERMLRVGARSQQGAPLTT